MKTYYFVISVVPSKNSPEFKRTAGSLAHFWIVDESDENAVNRANHFLSEYMWNIVEWQTAVETKRELFAGKEDGLLNYDRAQTEGLVAVFLSWVKDGRLGDDEVEIEPL